MSQLNTTTYDLQRPSGVCAATGDALIPGDPCFVALVDPPLEEREAQAENTKPKPNDGGDPPLLRVDLSAKAWDTGFRPPHLFGYWRTVVPEPNEKKKLLVGDAAIQELMLSLTDTQEPKQLAFRYVLALILLRKKLLRHDGIDRREDPDGEHSGGGPVRDWWRFTPKLDIDKGHLGKWNEQHKIEVLDPHITEAEIAGVTEQLGQVLEINL
ncbi:MAG: hypothetical protein AAGC44_04500 [Planctomycetota bacterium]